MMAVALVGGLGLLVGGLRAERSIVGVTGVPASRVASVVAPGRETCRAVDVDGPVSRARLVVGTFSEPGPALNVRVGTQAGRLRGGYADNATVLVDLPKALASFGPGERVGPTEVCVRNVGRTRAALYGAPPATRPSQLDDPDRRALFAVTLEREPRSALAALPDAVARSARFDAGLVTGGLVWTLLALVALVAPLALARAAVLAGRSEGA